MQARKRAESYRDLIVWQRACEVVRHVFHVCGQLPREQRYVLTNQVQRAAISIPANIAEGWGRGSRRELHQFVTVARGSLYELECFLDLTEQLGFTTPQLLSDSRAKMTETGKMLSALRSALRAKPRSPRS
jgi:four helix bundle protein